MAQTRAVVCKENMVLAMLWTSLEYVSVSAHLRSHADCPFIHSFLPSFIHSFIHSFNQSIKSIQFNSFTDSLATAQRRLFWGLFCAALFNILQGKVSLHTNSICSSEYSGFHSFHPHAGNPTWHQCVLQLEIPGFLYWDSWYIMFISFISLFIYHNVHHCLSNSS